MVQFCLTRDEAVPEHRYLGQTGLIVSNQGRDSLRVSILGASVLPH